MKIQTIINCVFAVAFVGYVVSQLNPTFDTITCKTWRVVDADGKKRITAFTNPDGEAIVNWCDKDGKVRIYAGTFADGEASVRWLDKDEKLRIAAATLADGTAAVLWSDKDEKLKILAATRNNGTVLLPTQELTPPTP